MNKETEKQSTNDQPYSSFGKQTGMVYPEQVAEAGRLGLRDVQDGMINQNDLKQTKPAANIYVDELHGFTAKCGSKTMAWQLIRNKCHELKLPVPTMDKIKLQTNE